MARHVHPEGSPLDMTEVFHERLENPSTREEYLDKLLQMADYQGDGCEVISEEVKGLVRRLAEGSADRLIDPLTELPNRRAFETELCIAIEHFQRSDGAKGFDLVMIDLVDFGSINKSHGFAEGDRMLTRFSEVLQSTRAVDRFFRSGTGGDEFYGIVAAGSGQDLLERVRMVSQSTITRPDGKPLEFYAGIASAEEVCTSDRGTTENADSLVDTADGRLRQDYQRYQG